MNFYKGFRRIKVKPAKSKARWWWVQVRSEDAQWLEAERVNKYGEPLEQRDGHEHIQLISKGAILESLEADINRKYGELETA